MATSGPSAHARARRRESKLNANPCYGRSVNVPGTTGAGGGPDSSGRRSIRPRVARQADAPSAKVWVLGPSAHEVHDAMIPVAQEDRPLHRSGIRTSCHRRSLSFLCLGCGTWLSHSLSRERGGSRWRAHTVHPRLRAGTTPLGASEPDLRTVLPLHLLRHARARRFETWRFFQAKWPGCPLSERPRKTARIAALSRGDLKSSEMCSGLTTREFSRSRWRHRKDYSTLWTASRTWVARWLMVSSPSEKCGNRITPSGQQRRRTASSTALVASSCQEPSDHPLSFVWKTT